MATTENEYYLRSILLLAEGGSYISKKVLYREHFGDLDKLLKGFERELKHELHEKQIETLFPRTGNTIVDTWDLQMLIIVVLRLFHNSLKREDKKNLRVLKSLRNEVQAHNPSATLDVVQYENINDQLTDALTCLASGFDEHVQQECRLYINKYTSGPLDVMSARECLKQLQDNDVLFKQVLEKIESSKNDICATQKSLSDDVKNVSQQMTDFEKNVIEHLQRLDTGTCSKKIKVCMQVELSLGGPTTEWVHLMERTLDDVFNEAYKTSGEKFEDIKKRVEELLKDIKQNTTISFKGSKTMCIILMFECVTYSGLLDLLQYLTSQKYRGRLSALAETLSTHFKVDIPVTATSTISPACLQNALDKLEHENEKQEAVNCHSHPSDESKKSLKLLMECSSVKDLVYLWEMFQKGGAAEYLDRIADTLSECSGERITLSSSINLEEFKAALEDTGHHKMKQEKERQETQEREEALARSMALTTLPSYGDPTFMPQWSPRYPLPQHGLHPVALSRVSRGGGMRGPGAKHQPYPMARPSKPPLNFDQQGQVPVPGPSTGNKFESQVVKIEPDDEDEKSNQSVNDSVQTSSSASVPGNSEPPSPSTKPSTPSQTQGQHAPDNDDAKSESSTSTIANKASDLKLSDTAPPEGLSLDSDLSNLISASTSVFDSNVEQPATSQDSASEPQTPPGLDSNVSVKLEAVTDSKIGLEITGVGLGQTSMQEQMSSQEWMSNVQNIMQGATGSSADTASQQSYKMADKYYRLVSLEVNVCPLPLRELFHLCAQTDNQFTGPYTAQSYLQFRRNDITRALATNTIRRDQYNKIYPATGQTDLTGWDTTLLIAILKLLFRNTLTGQVLNDIEHIRDCRNYLQHISATANMSDGEFNAKWGDLEAATVALANNAKGALYADDIQKRINSAKTSHMPDIRDVLCDWYKENTLRLENKVDTLQEEVTYLKGKLDTVSKKIPHTKLFLDNVTDQRQTMGIGTKRFKTVDDQLNVMQRRFSETLRHKLPGDNPNSFLELPVITKKLREDHFVAICGSRRSLYFQAALTAIKNMGYPEDRCFELNKASEWWRISFEEADCIVVVNPFGKIGFDQSKASDMTDLFDSMLSATKDEKYQNFTFRDIVIISDKELLDECKKYFNHKLLGSEITILDNSHILASKDRAISLPSSFSEADTYDTSVTKGWKFIKEINVKSYDEASCLITGMCMVPPNQIAVTDQHNDSLKLANIRDGRIIDRVMFSTFPGCPTLLPQDRLAVLLPQEHIIQLFSIDNSFGFNKENAIKLNGNSCSIMFENGVFFAFLFSPAVVKTLNIQGEELSMITLESDILDMNINPMYAALCPEKTSFYISDWGKDLLLRVNMEGHMMAMYKDNGLIKPNGILAMSDGSVYVCNRDNDTLLQMRADFTRSRVVLGPSDNVAGPAAICYWPEENTMFVSSSSQNPMHNFKLKMFTLI
ncbi:uncharacterized protein LOC123540271 [Mercenaria mercenaria]|uniref:uncharacterized protein LOC123540271 n=1 Tax=Mercenaria mercenaria TaxID=6596 RepID=UPI00234ED3C4|nr:uncharacterized protein LOC123540271 [Mercenaria mercenaria]XP_053382870.1 uncharacterized protein LOC123540271 [Mercenaria mercenaria]